MPGIPLVEVRRSSSHPGLKPVLKAIPMINFNAWRFWQDWVHKVMQENRLLKQFKRIVAKFLKEQYVR